MASLGGSCDFARDYLPRMGVTATEVEDICASIICTGPRSKISQIAFRTEEGRHMAFALLICGIGALVVLIRVVNPAYPEAMMLVILFMNVMAPLIAGFERLRGERGARRRAVGTPHHPPDVAVRDVC